LTSVIGTLIGQNNNKSIVWKIIA